MVFEQVVAVLVDVHPSASWIAQYPTLVDGVAIGRHATLAAGGEAHGGPIHPRLRLHHYVVGIHRTKQQEVGRSGAYESAMALHWILIVLMPGTTSHDGALPDIEVMSVAAIYEGRRHVARCAEVSTVRVAWSCAGLLRSGSSCTVYDVRR